MGKVTIAARGDFDEFYTLHFADIVTMTYSLTGSFDEAQDITQESFCRAWQRWAGVSAYDNPITWVRRVAINLAVSRWRQLRTATAYRLRLRVEEPVAAPADAEHVEIVAELRKLPANQRTALVLHYLVDLPVEQVAEQLQAPVGTVKVWLYRGRQSLAAQLTTQTQAVPAKPATDEIIQRARRRRDRKITVLGVLALLVLVAATVSAAFFRGPAPVISPTPTPSALCTYQGNVVVPDGETIAKGRLVNDAEALLVMSSPDSGKRHLLWRGRLFEVRQQFADRLNPGGPTVVVAQAFLDELPKGQPIEPIEVEGAGDKSTLNPGWTVGEVITIFGVTAEDRYALVRQGDLSYVTQLQAQLAAFNGRRMSIGELTDNGRITVRNDLLPSNADEVGQPPGNLPRFLMANGSSVCSVGVDGDTHRQTVINVPLP